MSGRTTAPALLLGAIACSGEPNPGQAITNALHIPHSKKLPNGAFVQAEGPYDLEALEITYETIKPKSKGELALQFNAVFVGPSGAVKTDTMPLQMHFNGADEFILVEAPVFEGSEALNGGDDTGSQDSGSSSDSGLGDTAGRVSRPRHAPSLANYPPLPDNLTYYATSFRMDWTDKVDFNVCGTVAVAPSGFSVKKGSTQEVVCYYCEAVDGACYPEQLHKGVLDIYASNTQGFDYLRLYDVRVRAKPKDGAPAPEDAPLGKYSVDRGYTTRTLVDPSIGYRTKICDPAASTDGDINTVPPGNPYESLWAYEGEEISVDDHNILTRTFAHGMSSRLEYYAVVSVEGWTTRRTAEGWPRDLKGPVEVTCEGNQRHQKGTCPVLAKDLEIPLPFDGCNSADLSWYLGAPGANWVLRRVVDPTCALLFLPTPSVSDFCPDCDFGFDPTWAVSLDWRVEVDPEMAECGDQINDMIGADPKLSELSFAYEELNGFPVDDPYPFIGWSMNYLYSAWAWEPTDGGSNNAFSYGRIESWSRYPGYDEMQGPEDLNLSGTWDPAKRSFLISNPYGTVGWGVVP